MTVSSVAALRSGTRLHLSASPTSKRPTQYGPTATEAPFASSAWPPETPSPTAFVRPSKPLPTVSQGIRSAVSSMATSIENASMLRSNNLPPSAHSPLTQSKRAVEALPSGWPSNTSKPRIHLRKTNNQASRSFLAYLAFRSIFFPHESAGRGAYLSFLSPSPFFFRKALRSRERNKVIQESPKTTYRG
jgi:hypothetical protein